LFLFGKLMGSSNWVIAIVYGSNLLDYHGNQSVYGNWNFMFLMKLFLNIFTSTCSGLSLWCYRLIIGEELFAVRLPEDIANNVIMVFSHLLGVALSGLGLVDSEVWLYLCRLVFISYFKQICRISSCWVKLLSGFFYLFKNWALYCMKVMSLKTMEFGSIFVKISNCFTVSLELELV